MNSESGSVQNGWVLAPAPNGTRGAAIKGWKLQQCINDKSLAEIAQFLAKTQQRSSEAPCIMGGK